MKKSNLIVLSLLALGTIATAQEATQDNLTKLYIATFDRAPDVAGLEYWINTAIEDGWTLEDIAQSFFDQEETQKKYPAWISNKSFIETVYANLFDREGDKEGVAYWEEALEGGRVSREVFLLAAINGALGDDKLLLECKTDAALIHFIEKGIDNSYRLRYDYYEIVDAPKAEGGCVDNKAPTSVIEFYGASLSVIQVGEKTTLNGGFSTDSDGTIVSYEWSNGKGNILGTQQTQEYTGTTVGFDNINLKVTDDDGVANTATQVIETYGGVNNPPVINSVTGNLTITEGDNLQLTADATDPDGDTLTYTWTEKTDVDIIEIGKNLDLAGLQEGTYTMVLTVKDGNGGYAKEEYKIVVEGLVVNEAPTLNLDITLNGTRGTIHSDTEYTQHTDDTITLDATNSTDDGEITKLIITSDLKGELYNGVNAVYERPGIGHDDRGDDEIITINVIDNKGKNTNTDITIHWE